MALMLINLFEFFIPQYAFAVKTSEILKDAAPTKNCLQAMESLSSYLEQKAVPIYARPDDAQQTYAEKLNILWNNKEFVKETLSLILYKILPSEEQTSSKKTFSEPISHPPRISLKDYIDRFLIYSPAGGNISQAAVISTLMSLDEMLNENGGSISVKHMGIHRSFAASYSVAVKFWEDDFFNNAYMAKVAGVVLSEMNIMEAYFLAQIHFHLLFEKTHIDTYRNLFEGLLKKVPNLEWDFDYKCP